MSAQNPGGLTWRAMNVDPSCSEVRIEVAWGAWPYKITAYGNEAIVQRYVPDSPSRVTTVVRGDRPFDAMMAEARAIAEGWDAQMQAEAARAGLVAIR